MNLRNEIIILYICLPIIIWVNLTIKAIGTVSDLGFPARGAMCPSQQFSVGHSVFWGVTIFFNSNVTDIMLSTYAMFEIELNIPVVVI